MLHTSCRFTLVQEIVRFLRTHDNSKLIQENLAADAKVSVRQQCVYEGLYRKNLSSAENPTVPTLKPNITSIGKPVAKLWPFLYIKGGRQQPSWIFWNLKVALLGRSTPKTPPRNQIWRCYLVCSRSYASLSIWKSSGRLGSSSRSSQSTTLVPTESPCMVLPLIILTVDI